MLQASLTIHSPTRNTSEDSTQMQGDLLKEIKKITRVRSYCIDRDQSRATSAYVAMHELKKFEDLYAHY